MPPPGNKPTPQPLGQRVAQLGRASRSQKLVWKVDGRRSTDRFDYRAVKFFNWETDEQLQFEEEEGYETLGEDGEAKPPEIVPRQGDWAILMPKDPAQKFKPRLAHLVPARLLDHQGAVFCYDGSVTMDDKWVQVLPVDAKGKFIPRAVADCKLSQSIQGEHGDVIAIQTVPASSPALASQNVALGDDESENRNTLPPDSSDISDDDSEYWSEIELPDLKSDDKFSSKDPALEVEDLSIVVTVIRGRCSERWQPDIDAFLSSDDDGSGTDSDDMVVLESLYARFHLAAPGKKREQEAIAKLNEGLPLMQEAQDIRAGHRKQNGQLASKAKDWAMGVVQFMEDGAPSPEWGTTTGLAFSAWIAQMSETPMPEGGWFNAPPEYQAPDTPVSDGFGLVSSPLDMACLVVAFAKSCKNLVDIANDDKIDGKERDKRAVSELCNMATYVGHMGVAGIGIADIAYGAWAKGAHIAEQTIDKTSGHLTVASSVVGVVVGIYVTARNSRKAESARRRMNKLNKLRKDMDRQITGNRASERALLEHLTFAEHKLKRKKFTKAFSATAAALGTTGSTGALVVAAIGTTAAANAWNPVGWTIFAVGLGVGLGVTGYVLWRRFRRSHRHKHRRKVGRPVNAHAYAVGLAQAYLDPEFKRREPRSWRFVKRQLEAIGIKDKKLGATDKPPTPQRMAKLVSLIERKVT
jgi:hypothetical protein